ncbi:hypothetical protein JCM17823_22320 [Halorubrum gandharaense]
MTGDVNGSGAAVAARLRRPLEAAEDDEARYQLREALQLCMAAEDGTEADGAGVGGASLSTDGGRPR